MNSYVKYIGVIDSSNKTHYVPFTRGLNIITGKSSTGKSAMIEIFDYCFGSSDFTVPEGVITENAKLYFVILGYNDSNLILARKPYRENKNVFIKLVNEVSIDEVNMDYFDEKHFIKEKDFNQELGHYFGIEINDTDIDTEDIKYRGKRKERPSVRHFMSFILQHQNLVANKHSIFYRFDEREKREQTIDQFKIFMGIVDQKYFLLMQQLSDLKRELKSVEFKEKSLHEHETQLKKLLINAMDTFKVLTGSDVFGKENTERVMLNPIIFIKELNKHQIEIDYSSTGYSKHLNELRSKRNSLLLEKRDFENKKYKIDMSIESVENYKRDMSSLSEVDIQKLENTICPFCNSENNELECDVNGLSEAFEWLNLELKKTPYLLDSFQRDQKLITEQIDVKNNEIRGITSEIKEIEKINKKLKEQESLEKQSQKIILKIESILEELIDVRDNDLESQRNSVQKRINTINSELKEKYNKDGELRKAENLINRYMKEIGKDFDFEETYKPVNLKFSLETFDLWNETKEKKVFLRSMGSGANWLYSHICLFLALQSYFCENSKCMIPPILFLDQPSQVYFPNVIDHSESFDHKSLTKDLSRGSVEADEDLKAVTNLFNKLEEHCMKMSQNFYVEPQIIVTDHADNIEMKSNNFEKYVNGRRWRKRGFIDPVPSNQ